MDETLKSKAERRRRRPALACVSCRRSKIRCDRNLPCGACVRSRHKTCVFEPHDLSQTRSSEIQPAKDGQAQVAHANDASVSPEGSTSTGLGDPHGAELSALSLTGSTLVDSSSSTHDVPSLLGRVRELERRLEECTVTPPAPKPPPRAPGAVSEPIQSYLASGFHSMNKSVMSKNRYFGQSHWMNGVTYFKSILELFEAQSQEKSEAMSLLNRCKTLARTVKAQRRPEMCVKLGTNIPSRDVADKLVDGYLRTLETVFRIIHVPSFRSEYEKVWLSPDSVDPAFLIQLQLVMAIGSTVYDDQFSMRRLAMQWVFEAQHWLLAPFDKSRLSITGLQIMLLLSLARETAGVGADLVWISHGTVLRTAIYMGLHRDPSRLPRMTRLRAELRRRVWNTILEFSLQSSMDSGGPPMIPLENTDVIAPANVDDYQLTEADTDTPPSSSPKGEFTDMSIPLALRASYSARLAVARLLNDIASKGSYEDTIRLHGQLNAAYKSLSQTLQAFAPAGRQPTPFQRRFVDFIVRRYFLSLHLPYLGPAMKDPAYAFSRKAVVESSLKIYHAALSVPPLRSKNVDLDADAIDFRRTEGDDLARFNLCGAGYFRSIVSQSSMTIAFEVQSQLQEDEGLGLGPPTARPDLLDVLRDASYLYLERVKTGETNVKGALFMVALTTHADALIQGRQGESLLEPILNTAIKSERRCFEMLKEQAGQNPSEDAATAGGEQVDWDAMMNIDEDWGTDSNALSAFFNFTSIDSTFEPDFMMPPGPSPW